MSKVNDLVLEIVEGRKEAKKRIKEEIVKKAVIADYVFEILKAFKVSNEEEQSAILLWQLKLCGATFEYLSIMMSFERGADARFYNTIHLDPDNCKKNLLGNNERLKEYIKNLKIPSAALDELYKYSKKEFYENFKISKQGEGIDKSVIIELKS